MCCAHPTALLPAVLGYARQWFSLNSHVLIRVTWKVFFRSPLDLYTFTILNIEIQGMLVLWAYGVTAGQTEEIRITSKTCLIAFLIRRKKM